MNKPIIDKNITWQEISPGGVIYNSGTASEFNTGDWRNERPLWSKEKCKQCMLCFPVCPDSSIIVEQGEMCGIDYQHCKGCAVCADACPFDAIAMQKELSKD